MVRIPRIFHSAHGAILRFRRDVSGLAAVEFVFIVPVMLTLVFGTIEVASVVAIDRKVTLVARTLSDLVSQGTNVTDSDIKNFFGMGTAIMTPYQVAPDSMGQKITAVNVDAAKVAKVVWSFAGTATGNVVSVAGYDPKKLDGAYKPGLVITTIPPALLVPNTQLIWSEVSYTYTPVLGYILKSKWPMFDQTYTRPRQSACVTLNSAACGL